LDLPDVSTQKAESQGLCQQDCSILSRLPGEMLGPTRNGFPEAKSDVPDTQRVVIRLPDGARAEVTYVRLKSTKGKSVVWFWTPTVR
jgi:hypothetical protein